MATRPNTVHDGNISTAVADATWTGDDVQLDRYPDKYTDGLDHASEDLASFSALAGWTGAIESSPLLFQCTLGSVRFRCRNSGPILAGSNNAANFWLKLYIELASNEPLLLTSALWVKATYMAAGRSEYYDVIVVGTIQMDGGSLWVRRSATNTTTGDVVVNDGRLQIDRDPDDVTVNGGEFVINHETCTPATLTINGGTVRVGTHGGTFPAVTLNRGVLDLSQVSMPLTITAATLGNPKNCRVIMPSDASLITWSSVTLATKGDPRYMAA